MKRSKQYILIALCALLLMACGTKRRAVSTDAASAEQSTPAWHTCLMQGVQLTVTTDEERLSATATMQVVRDSMLIISVMPMLGIEMLRVEATPTLLTVIDKIHGQYGQAEYTALNRKLVPAVNWDVLQQLCSAELPTGSEKTHMRFVYDGRKTLDLNVVYPTRQLDVPMRMNAQKLQKYQKIDISKWL